MTQLEQLIEKQVAQSMLARIGRATDTIAEELASEMLRDAGFRARLQAFIDRAFTNTVTALTIPDVATLQAEILELRAELAALRQRLNGGAS